jgi:hypothetical protein
VCFLVTECNEAGNGESLDYESRALIQFCESNRLLLSTYHLLHEMNSSKEEPSHSASSESVKQVKKLINIIFENFFSIGRLLEVTVTLSYLTNEGN